MRKKAMMLKALNKSNVWDIQENDVFRMWEAASNEVDFKENMRKYVDIIKSAFDVQDVLVDKPEVIKKLEKQGFKVGTVKVDGEKKVAIRKHAIMQVNDLTYENIHHISVEKLIEVLRRNFGSGWESLPQKVQDIIESGFSISTTTLPTERLHRPGGLYEHKLAEGYQVLEIGKGSWTEAIFAKEKPDVEERPVVYHPAAVDDEPSDDLADDKDAGEDVDGKSNEDDDDSFDDDKLTEESYRTTYETDPEDLNYEAESISDDSDDDNF